METKQLGAVGRRKQGENGRFETSLGYINRLCLERERRELSISCLNLLFYCTILTLSRECTWFDIGVSSALTYIVSAMVRE